MSPRPKVEEQRRQEIMDAAIKCFSRKGYDATSMDDITAELPFSKALIYYYFKSKKEILSAILKHTVAMIYRGWEEITAKEEDPYKQFQRMADTAIEYVLNYQTLWRIELEFWGHLGREPEVLSTFREMFFTLRTKVAQIIQKGIARGQFRALDADSLAAALVAVFDGLILQIVADPSAMDWKEVSRTLIDSLLNGIRAT